MRRRAARPSCPELPRAPGDPIFRPFSSVRFSGHRPELPMTTSLLRRTCASERQDVGIYDIQPCHAAQSKCRGQPCWVCGAGARTQLVAS